MKLFSPFGKLLLLLTPLALRAQQLLPMEAVPVAVEVPFVPAPVRAMGKANLVYEVHLTNFGPTALALDEVAVFPADASAAPLASYHRPDLAKRLVLVSYSPPDKAAPTVIGSGQRAILFLLLSTDGTPPAALRHRFTFHPAADSTGASQVLDDVRIAVPREEPLALQPPLRGRWLAGNGLSNNTEHRRSLKVLNGHPCIAQRFATDWVQLGEDGRLARQGDMTKNENYYGYGAEALAVAPATVLAVKDSIPENDAPQTKKRAVPITLATIAGNYVLLDLGRGRYALYGHLQPHHLRVKPGDRVKTGQVLGLVGNSGNSSLPHLHFHITNAPSALAAEGIPYVLPAFLMPRHGRSQRRIREARL